MTPKRMRPWREGVATKNPAFGRDLPNWWSWIPTYFGLAIATTWFEESGSRLGVGGAYVLALLLGVAWQLGHPRDLADRLVIIAVLVSIVGLVILLPFGGGASLARHDTRHFVLLVPLVAGLVLGEQWTRWKARSVRD